MTIENVSTAAPGLIPIDPPESGSGDVGRHIAPREFTIGYLRVLQSWVESCRHMGVRRLTIDCSAVEVLDVAIIHAVDRMDASGSDQFSCEFVKLSDAARAVFQRLESETLDAPLAG